MPANVVHFDIQADDVERARAFYESVFGWRFEPWGPPDYYLIRTGTDVDPGIHGSLSRRPRPIEGRGRIGWECTIAVDAVAPVRQAIVASGGTILVEEQEIVGVGSLLRFADTEGNSVCAMRYAS